MHHQSRWPEFSIWKTQSQGKKEAEGEENVLCVFGSLEPKCERRVRRDQGLWGEESGWELDRKEKLQLRIKLQERSD